MAGKNRNALSLPRAAAEALEQAHALVQRRRYEDAQEILTRLDRQYPNQFFILQMLGEAAYETRDDRQFLDVSDRMALLRPDSPEVLAQRAYAHLRMGLAFLAKRYFEQVVSDWPGDPIAAKARQTLIDLAGAIEATKRGILETGDYPAEDVPDLATRHEQIQVWLARGKFADARRVAASLLARWPKFAPAYNNVAESWMREGNLAQAIVANQQTLAVMPHNAHALAALVTLRLRQGKDAEAREAAERLSAQPAQHPDNRVKAAEALALFGDDAGVLRVWEEAEQEGFRLQPIHLAYAHHLAAVAAYRTGDEKRARELWAKCLRAVPNFDLASDCIADLDRPVGDRHGPWPCPLYVLVPPTLGVELQAFVEARIVGPDTKTRDEARKFLQKNPDALHLMRLLLRVADPFGCLMALRVVAAARTEQTLPVLREFALGRRGRDELRLAAALVLCGPDVAGQELTLWRDGQPRPFSLFPFEIVGHRTGEQMPSRAEKLMAQGQEFLARQQPGEAEKVYRQAMAIVPDQPSLLNDLSNALEMQGRHGEADEVREQIHARHPDYFFGVVMRARAATQSGDTDEAARLLASAVAGRKELHVSEFVSLAIAETESATARRRPEEARHWADLLKASGPSDRHVAAAQA